MTRSEIEKKMIEVLNKNFTKNATEKTVHKNVLRSDDGEGHATSQRVYKGLIRWILKRKKHPLKDWPSDWMDLTVGELATKIA